MSPSSIRRRSRFLPNARILDPLIGERRQLTRRDVDDVLPRGAGMPNGRYRVLASRFAEGAPLGNFRYYGTRPDDPNDIVPHEDRRELRAARVFGAWLNHDDSRGVNSLDMLHTDGGRRYVKHYMFDFGSIMGSGTVFAQRHRAGNEYIVEWAPGWLTLATLGLYTRDWLHIDYPDVPASVGRFEAQSFDPVKWRPEYPNTAFDNMRADDAFWAARIVSKFSDADIRAIVAKARYSDPRATEYIDGHAHRAAQSSAEDVADRHESAGGFRTERGRRAHVQQRGSPGCGSICGFELSGQMVPIRQRDRRGDWRCRRSDRHRDALRGSAAGTCGSGVRPGRNCSAAPGLPRMEYSCHGAFPPCGEWLVAGWGRAPQVSRALPACRVRL